MVTRTISANASEILRVNGAGLKQSIETGEGRTVLNESAVVEPAIDGLTASEIAVASGVDLISLNSFDTLNLKVSGLTADRPEDIVKQPQKLTGRSIGVDLEPVGGGAEMESTKLRTSASRTATVESMKATEKLGFSFVRFTGNPDTGVTSKVIIKAIETAKENFSGLIIAGKMYGARVDEPVANEGSVKAFLDAGADMILVSVAGTIPDSASEKLIRIVRMVYERGRLVMSTIGANQEDSSAQAVRDIALQNKICSVGIQHIGDAGWGVAPPTETAFELSEAIRGVSRTIF